MAQINVELKTLQRWFNEGVAQGATAMTIITDTFPHEPEQYPEYEIPGKASGRRESMQMAGQRFTLTTPLASQLQTLSVSRCSCYNRLGPCGCG